MWYAVAWNMKFHREILTAGIFSIILKRCMTFTCLAPDVFLFGQWLVTHPRTSVWRLYNWLRDRLQIWLHILSKFKRINIQLFPLKSSENLWFSDDFRGNNCILIRLNSLNMWSEIWRRSLNDYSWQFEYGNCMGHIAW